MTYSGSQSEKAVPAGELDRSHVGQTVSFQSNDLTVVFGKIAGIARTEAQVYLTLDGVGGGTHLKDEYNLSIDQNVYLPAGHLAGAEKPVSDAMKTVRDRLDAIRKNKRGRAESGLE
jgi:hypothetical protein